MKSINYHSSEGYCLLDGILCEKVSCNDCMFAEQYRKDREKVKIN